MLRIRGGAGQAGRGLLRRLAGIVDFEAGEDAVHLPEQLLPRAVVVVCVFFRARVVAVEPLENVEIRPDRPEVARGDRLGRDRVRALESDELKERVVGRQVGPLLIQGVLTIFRTRCSLTRSSHAISL
jgi:hypothetical protein